jgi:hypothetical protein
MYMGCDLLSTFIFDNVLTIQLAGQQGNFSCDLLSTFIFDNVLTIRSASTLSIEHMVVICFQLLSLTTFLQFFVIPEGQRKL